MRNLRPTSALLVSLSSLSLYGCSPAPAVNDVDANIRAVTPSASKTSLLAGEGVNLSAHLSTTANVKNPAIAWEDSPKIGIFDERGTNVTHYMVSAEITQKTVIRVTARAKGNSNVFGTLELNVYPRGGTPTLAGLTPTEAMQGMGAQWLTLRGTGFSPASVVRVQGQALETAFVSETELRGLLPADRVNVAGDLTITVSNTGGAASTAQTFKVNRPQSSVPRISGLNPAQARAGRADLNITVEGDSFAPDSVVRWNGQDRPTRYIAPFRLEATLSATDFKTAGQAKVAVFTPTPGGGTSNDVGFTIAAAPQLTSISPSRLYIGSARSQITLTGIGLSDLTGVLVNNLSQYIYGGNGTEVSFSVDSKHLQSPGVLPIAVTQGYGTDVAKSNTLNLTVESVPVPAPESLMLTPAWSALGSQAVQLAVFGHSFTSSSKVLWNDQERPTRYESPNRVVAQIPSSDLNKTTVAAVTVKTPGVLNPSAVSFVVEPASGASQNMKTVPLKTNDLAYVPSRNLLYASVPSTEGAHGNNVIAIDPNTATIVNQVFVGSEPADLAVSDDGAHLYVGLRGAAFVVRVALESFTVDQQASLGADPFFGPLYAEDIEVLPGTPERVAVSLYRKGVSPRHGGVALLEDGNLKPLRTGDHTGSNVLVPSVSPNVLYGYNNETTDYGLRKMVADQDGVQIVQTRQNSISGFYLDIAYAAGRVYAGNGGIVDAESGTPVGSFGTSPILSFAPDSRLGKVFVLTSDADRLMLQTYSMSTFQQLTSLSMDLPVQNIADLLRWGNDGLAFRQGNQIVILTTALVRQ